MPKIYVHSETTPDASFTLAVDVPPSCRNTVFDLGAHFATAYNAANPSAPKPFAPNAVSFVDANGVALSSAACITQLASDGDDIFATHGSPTAPPKAVIAASASARSISAASSSSTTSSPSEVTELIKALTPYIKKADSLFKDRSFKKAFDIYNEVVTTVERANYGAVGVFPEKLVVALRRLGEIEVVNERPAKAMPWLERAKRIAPRDVETRVVLADAHWAAEDEEEAVAEMQGALDVIDKTKRPKKTKSLSIKLGLMMFKAGQRPQGGGLLTKLLKEDQEDQEALQAYGEAALALGQVEDALKIYLRLIVAKSEDRRVRELLSTTLKSPGALNFLNEHLPASKASASALAFLASTVKDHSGVKEAIALYEDCAKHAPDNSSYALNVMHLHELHLDYCSAIAALTRHCEANPSCTVGTLSLSELLAYLPTEAQMSSDSWSQPTAEELTTAKAHPVERVLPDLPSHTGAESLEPEKCKPAGTYSEEALDVLALAYTAVKVLYVAGCLASLPKLISLVEPAREVKDLHLTRVRNENAYYCCTAQLVTSMPLPLPSLPSLYVMGDSHSLAPAWRTVAFRGETHLLVPRLVTGCKVWHLREKSEFFPKYNFEHAAKSMPDGAPVVCIFGEIDCREGLLLAVERMRYPSLEDGIAHTIKIYISVLKDLVKTRRLKIFVHPVPPVLNETRHIVTIFNRQLVKAVAAEPSLTMLDFFDELLTPEKTLKEELKLDGTHMHPRYVSAHMEPALARVA